MKNTALPPSTAPPAQPANSVNPANPRHKYHTTRREALEESGLEVDLVGILGIEHTLKGLPGEEEDARMRVIYYARPAKGRSDKPKSKPDEESDGE